MPPAARSVRRGWRASCQRRAPCAALPVVPAVQPLAKADEVKIPFESAQAQVLARYGIGYESRSDLSREALLDQYRQADLLLFASTYEGFGLPIVEANAVGRPRTSP